jgi:hypothetical protein
VGVQGAQAGGFEACVNGGARLFHKTGNMLDSENGGIPFPAGPGGSQSHGCRHPPCSGPDVQKAPSRSLQVLREERKRCCVHVRRRDLDIRADGECHVCVEALEVG